PVATPTSTPPPPHEPITRGLPESPVVSTPPGPYTAIAVGGHEAVCALTEAGELACWAWGDQVATIVSNERHIDLDADSGTTCAVTEAGEVACWGVDESASDAPPGPYTMVSTTDGYTCGVTEAGEVLCWGSHSERGRGASDEDRDYSSGYVGRMPDLPPDSYVAVTVGYSDYLDGTLLWACAARAGGGFTCQRSSGKYLHGEASVRREDGGPGEGLARGDFCSVNGWGDPSCSGSGLYADVSHGGDYACAVTNEGEAECWVAGVWAQELGRFGLMTPPKPSTARYAAISNSDGRGCALTEAGEAVCWRAVPNVLSPPDPQPGPYVAVSDGRNHTCALTEAGQAVCWGWNNWGQAEAPAGRYTAISAGDFDTCALTEAGEEVCRGTFPSSLLGSHVTCALTDTGEAACRGVDAPSGHYTALAVGWQHACALTDAGEPVCWAWESRRYDGYKEDTPAESPYHDQLTQPPSGPFSAISASEFRTCALTESGEVVCWGDVDYEQSPLWASIE
ncbi:MAG: hypothetical protein F4Z07_13375, partial [Dehalococcoidia bacterium]|nr:hypothetical protein [Dehalococcoidia bacterium]